MKIFALFAFLIILSSPIAPLQAQEALEETDFTVGSDVKLDNIDIDQTVSEFDDKKDKTKEQTEVEVTVIEDKYAGQYVEPTLQNISKLYWNKGALLEANDKAIDNFMMINECDIYQKFYRDDFEWERVRTAGREMIKENKAGFSDKFKMVVPIDLGRYDMIRKGFPLINKTAFKDLRRVEIGGNSNQYAVCEEDRVIEYYPRNLILILNKPFTYEFVYLDEHIAQAFIIRQKYEKVNRPKELVNQNFDRLAFARMRITFDKYQGETRGSDNYPLAVMFGRLDGIDIFEDASEKRLLTSVDYK